MSLKQRKNMYNLSQFITAKLKASRLNLLLKKRFKVYLDLDMIFYSIDYDRLNANLVYKEAQFYDKTIEGIPAYLKIPIGDTNEYFHYPDVDTTKFNKGDEYAILTYKVRGAFSTKTVLLVLSMELDSIRIINHQI